VLLANSQDFPVFLYVFAWMECYLKAAQIVPSTFRPRVWRLHLQSLVISKAL
jgi:hypothetical protein